MKRYRGIGRKDSNHSIVQRTFKSLGCSVFDTSQMMCGFPDLVVGIETPQGKKTFLVEIKDGSKSANKQTLTEPEKNFFDSWKGEVYIIKSVEEAIALIHKLKGDLSASQVFGDV